jgi:hypothetical protein
MKMKLSRKFCKAAGAGVLGLAMLAGAGCSQSPQTPQQQQASAEKADGVYADVCLVVDKAPGHPYGDGPWASYNAYDFRNGVMLFGTTSSGTMTRAASAVPLSGLNDSGKARAMDMYNKLPASAKCEAPRVGPK